MSVYDVAIVGGGCVGSSAAMHLASQSELDICLIEKEHQFAAHQSGRNSGVLHPGFNYEPGSTKAKFSTEGTQRMKTYAAQNDIPLRELGVLVVAQSQKDYKELRRLHNQAAANGVTTEMLNDRAAIQEIEPHASGIAALHCPEAASIDSQQYVYSLVRDAANLGVDLFTGTQVTSVESTATGNVLRTSTGAITAAFVINAAGLHADTIAKTFGVANDYQIVPFRGEYYELRVNKRELVNTMVYPAPDPELPFLGVHFTRRSDDKVIVGPNAVLAFGREAYENTDYNLGDLRQTATFGGFWRLLASRKMLSVAVDELNKSYRKEAFVSAAQSLIPEVQETDFVKIYAGIRAQLVGPDGSLIKQPLVEHGPRSLHVLNAVSPGLTSSLPFGEHLAEETLQAYP